MLGQSLILISYKNKLLLSCEDLPFSESNWGLLGEHIKWTTPLLKNAADIIRDTTKLDIKITHKISLNHEIAKYIFCIKLTDKNVNSIVRPEGQRLEFYTLRETENLNISAYSGDILSSNYKEIKDFLFETI